MKKSMFFLCAMCAFILLNGCATIFSGTKDLMQVNSNAQGKVFVDGLERGKTNEQFYLKRKFSFKNGRVVEVKADGYTDNSYLLITTTAGAYWLNIFNGFSFCLVDLVTGAVTKPKETNITVNLEKK